MGKLVSRIQQDRFAELIKRNEESETTSQQTEETPSGYSEKFKTLGDSRILGGPPTHNKETQLPKWTRASLSDDE